MELNKSVFECKICNKNYKSYNSLGNHTRKFHQSISNTKSKPKVNLYDDKSKPLVSLGKPSKQCLYCNKIFTSKQSKYKHIKNKVCTKNDIILYDTNKIEQLEKEINELKNIITTTTNNIIINNGTNNNTNNTNNGTINNTTNNIIKVTFGAVCIYFAKQNIFMTTRFKIKINKFLF